MSCNWNLLGYFILLWIPVVLFHEQLFFFFSFFSMIFLGQIMLHRDCFLKLRDFDTDHVVGFGTTGNIGISQLMECEGHGQLLLRPKLSLNRPRVFRFVIDTLWSGSRVHVAPLCGNNSSEDQLLLMSLQKPDKYFYQRREILSHLQFQWLQISDFKGYDEQIKRL